MSDQYQGQQQGRGSEAAEERGITDPLQQQQGQQQQQQDTPDDGFTPEERAQFEAMREGKPQELPADLAGGVAADDGAAAGGADAGDQAGAGAAADTGAGKGAKAGEGGADAQGGAKGGEKGAAAGAQEGAGDDEEEGDDDAGDGATVGADGKPLLGADGKPKRPRVGLKKFLQMQTRARQAEDKIRELNDMLTRTDERLEILTRVMQPKAGAAQEGQQQQDDDPEPDPEADIVAWSKWSQRENKRLRQALTDVQEGRATERATDNVRDAYTGDMQAFAATEEGQHFRSAYQHLLNSRVGEVAYYLTGKDLFERNEDGQPVHRLTPQEFARVKAAVEQEEQQLAATALAHGQSPARRIMRLAIARGWSPPQQQQRQQQQQDDGQGAGGQQQQRQQQNGAGGGQQVAKAKQNGNGQQQQRGTVQDEIERAQRGLDASISLSNGGGSPGQPLTAKRLADMSDAEFARYAETLSDAEWKEVMGSR